MMAALSMDTLPPQVQERIACSISAAAKYQAPANIVLAIADKERGRPETGSPIVMARTMSGQCNFKSLCLSDLARYGITASEVAVAGCYSFDLTAWRPRQHIRKDKGDLWTKAVNYYSHSPQYNRVYRADMMRKATKWATWLDARFVIYEKVKPSATQQVMDHRQDVMTKANYVLKKMIKIGQIISFSQWRLTFCNQRSGAYLSLLRGIETSLNGGLRWQG